MQAELLRCLIFGATADGDINEGAIDAASDSGTASSHPELPSPTLPELQIALGEALLTILKRCQPELEGGLKGPIAIATCRQVPCCLESLDGPGFRVDGEEVEADPAKWSLPQTSASDFGVVRFEEVDDEARCYVASMLPQFTSRSGVVLFLTSVLLTRGVEAVRSDMDDSSATLIGQVKRGQLADHHRPHFRRQQPRDHHDVK